MPRRSQPSNWQVEVDWDTFVSDFDSGRASASKAGRTARRGASTSEKAAAEAAMGHKQATVRPPGGAPKQAPGGRGRASAAAVPGPEEEPIRGQQRAARGTSTASSEEGSGSRRAGTPRRSSAAPQGKDADDKGLRGVQDAMLQEMLGLFTLDEEDGVGRRSRQGRGR